MVSGAVNLVRRWVS